jgi:hypothetical protein
VVLLDHKDMKLLPQEKIENNDKSGKNRFVQLRKEGNFALYRREKLDGLLVGFEVFSFKTIQAGAPLPGGGTVEETYESYPGAAAFGRTAWFIGGDNAAERAHNRFDELVKGKVTPEPEIEEETVHAVTITKTPTTPIKLGLKFPDKPFTQKELAAFNGFDNYKVVYSDLQKGLASGLLVVAGERPAPRGKPAKLFSVKS